MGPVQLYVAPGIVLAVRFSALPAQTGPLLVNTGCAGVWFTVTFAVLTSLEQPLTVTTNE